MTQEEYTKLKYVIHHDPVFYIVERRWIIFWVVKGIDGSILHYPSIFKFIQQLRCDFYNSLFRYGYSRGCEAVLKSMVQHD